jgi:hypothetical protein
MEDNEKLKRIDILENILTLAPGIYQDDPTRVFNEELIKSK